MDKLDHLLIAVELELGLVDVVVVVVVVVVVLILLLDVGDQKCSLFRVDFA